jgi:hypothetical protein
MDSDDLIKYISTTTDNNTDEAKNALNNYCQQIKTQTSSSIQGVGQFTVNSLGTIQFQQEEIPTAFRQPVSALRVIHPEATHNMLVGNKETTSTVMTEYYNEEPAKKDLWWIWAIVFAVIGIAVIILYFNEAAQSPFFGNAASYKLA